MKKRPPLRRATFRRPASATGRLQDRNRKKSRAFFLERLEDRSLLAALIWTGGSGNNWSTGANWLGGAAPQPDDSLVFPASAGGFVSTNDFGAGTRFRSVEVSS